MSRGPTVFESGVENIPLFVQDADGAAITTLDHTSAITIKYRRQDQASWTTITKVTGTIGTATSSGFKHDEDGVYQLGLPATAKEGGYWVLVKWSGTGILTDQMLLPIHRLNHQDDVRAGLSALPNAAHDTPGGLPISDAGGLDMDAMAADVAGLDGEAMRGTDGANTEVPDNTQGAAVITALGNGTVVLHSDYDAAKDAASQSQITGGAYSLDTDANGRIRVVDGVGVGELDTLSGTVLLRAATQSSIDAIELETNELQGDWVNGGRLDLLIDAIKAKTDQMTYSVANKLDSNPTPTATICNKIADHVRRRTQSNVEASSDGDTLDLSSLYGFIQQAQESSISGTTLTVNKTDGATSLGTKTLTSNSAADPVTGIA